MRGMRQHRQSVTFLEIGNAEITYRELIVSVGIVFIMLILGSVIAGNITRDSLEQKKEYNTAISIESENMFDYGMRTNVGNAFCQGALEAVLLQKKALLPANTAEAVSTFITKMETEIATAVSVVLRLTGRRTKTVGRVQMLTCQNMERCVKSNIKMAEKIRLF